MKKILLLSIAVCIACHLAIGQGKDKSVPKKTEKANPITGQDQDRGNAYGKNKGEMSGREFGQQRAADAKAEALTKRGLAMQKIASQKDQIKADEEKIIRAKNKVQKQEESGEISAEAAKVKKEKIAQAEKKVKQIKDVVDKQNKQLEELNNVIKE